MRFSIVETAQIKKCSVLKMGRYDGLRFGENPLMTNDPEEKARRERRIDDKLKMQHEAREKERNRDLVLELAKALGHSKKEDKPTTIQKTEPKMDATEAIVFTVFGFVVFVFAFVAFGMLEQHSRRGKSRTNFASRRRKR